MPFVDTSSLKVIDRLPGWNGRYFHSTRIMTSHAVLPFTSIFMLRKKLSKRSPMGGS